MFRTVSVAIIRSFSLYTQQWCMPCSEQDQDGIHSLLNLLGSCQQTCLTYTIAMCTVKNS